MSICEEKICQKIFFYLERYPHRKRNRMMFYAMELFIFMESSYNYLFR